MKKIVILGATKGLGRALGRLCAERGDRLFLLGSVPDELERSARDLEIRGAQQPVRTAVCDLLDAAAFDAVLDEADRELDGLDVVVVTAAVFAQQQVLEHEPHLVAQLLIADFCNTLLFCEAARKRMLARGGGTLCVFSSVAGERGRKPVIIYGAAKAGLTHYLEGLDHKFRAQGLITVCVKPGFVRTSMTSGLKPPPFASDPPAVAQRVLRAIDQGTPEVYAPAIWRWIMMVIRGLPRSAMRAIEF